MTTITSANSQYILSIANLFSIGQALQGYSTDDAFATEDIEPAEIQMGVDGIMTAGYVPRQFVQTLMFQADSPSCSIFDQWWLAQNAIKDLYLATGGITAPSMGQKWALTKGVLTRYHAVPDAKKVFQPRRFGITWNLVAWSPT